MVERLPRVLVFDSGVGGLSVARCIHQYRPDAELVYLADNARFPYGDLAEPVVVERCCHLIGRALEETPCDVIVVACNTASTVALPALRAQTDVPVVGVVPAVKPAAASTENHRIGVLATPATIQRPYLDELIDRFAKDCEVVRLGLPELVRWAEDRVAGKTPPQDDVYRVLRPLRDAGVDTVVLGCTHYPLLLPWLQAALPQVRHWVDSGPAIARRVDDLLARAGFVAMANRATADKGAVVKVHFTGVEPANLDRFIADLGLRRVLRTIAGNNL
ncbi:MAG: glutamate racemase [Alteromonadaceae bacterium]|nr:glutamate racemase [Alteromonadaceae bacterium]